MWNPFSKKNKNSSSTDPNQMGFLQKMAMKKIMSMSPEEREKMMKKVLSPENVAKNKDSILAAMEQMKSSGQISQAQIEEAKRKLGL